MTDTLLSVSKLCVSFGQGDRQVAAVRDVSIELAAGEVLGVVGESGSGKSTLARVLAGLQQPTSGTALFRGAPIFANGRAFGGTLRREVQMVFQDPYASLNPRMTALTAVAEACRFHDGGTKAAAQQRAREILAQMGIGAIDAGKLPRQLSGGQRQRVSVARALAARPKVLIADEPTSAIDQSAQAQLLGLLNRLREDGLAIIMVSHDLGVIRYLAEKVHVMSDGAFVESGRTSDVFDHPQDPYTQTLIASIPGHMARAGSVDATPVP